MLVSMDVEIWIGAIATIAVFSYLYKDNPLWRVVEHAYVGMTAAYSVSYQFHTRIKPTVVDDIIGSGHWSYIIPILIGLAIYGRFVPSLNWVARYPLSIWVGYGAGMQLAYNVPPLMGQLTGTFRMLNNFDNILYVVCVATTLMYFFFTISREQPIVKYGASIGRWAIMVTLGAMFGNTVIYRYNLLLERIQFLFGEWLQIGGAA